MCAKHFGKNQVVLLTQIEQAAGRRGVGAPNVEELTMAAHDIMSTTVPVCQPDSDLE